MIRISHKSGRLGNRMLINTCASILSQKYDLKVEEYVETPGITLNYCMSGRMLDMVKVRDEELLDLTEPIKTGLDLGECYFQVGDFLSSIWNELTGFIPKATESKEGAFIHVRLGDVAHLSPPFSYYEECIKRSGATTGLVSSDSLTHDTVKKIEEMGFAVFDRDPAETMLEAAKYHTLILSKGTFSWWIGMMSNASQIYYPVDSHTWHGNIFEVTNWTPIIVT